MQCSHAARSRWRKWPKRKRVTVCTLSALAVLIAGAAIFCLTVPLFYWWPDGVPIPGTDGTMMFVRESDPEREYRVNYAANYPDFSVSLAPDEVLIQCGASRLYEWNRCNVEVEKVRLVDRWTNKGWAAEAVAQVRVDYVITNASLQQVDEGDRFLVYCGDRDDFPTQLKPGGSRENLYSPVPPHGAEVKEGAVWSIRLFHHDTMPIVCDIFDEDIDIIYEISDTISFDQVCIDNDYADYEYWNPNIGLVSDYFSFPISLMRDHGVKQTDYERYGIVGSYEGIRERFLHIEEEWVERLKEQ